MPETQPTPSGGDVEQNKVYAILGYIGILFLVPLLAAPKSEFAQYHARQGMVLFIVEVILMIVAWIITFATFGFGFVLVWIIWIAVIIWSILGIVNAANSVMKPLPLIGQFAKKK